MNNFIVLKRHFILVFLIVAVLSAPYQAVQASNPQYLPQSPELLTCANFSNLNPGQSVEGLGTVHPLLNINSPGNVVALEGDNDIAAAYGAPNAAANLGPSIVNNGLGPDGGFADVDQLNQDYHQYAFSFAPNTTVNYFSLKMLDFGDFNPNGATAHTVDLVAYNGNNQVVATDRLSFTSDSGVNPTSGSAGNLQITGDAITAQENEPGNFTFEVSGTAITRLEMQFSSDIGPGATDPNMGLAVLCFEPEELVPPTATCVDFNILPPGSSVEGLGTLIPDLNITSTGNAVVLAEGQQPATYGSPNGPGAILNNRVAPLGGFADIDQLHEYSFGFTPGLSVDYFSLNILDYGDYNPVGATQHEVSLVAYNASNTVVDTNTLSFTSDGWISADDDLWITGDATAPLGNPGNYLFEVAGSGITRLELQFSSNLGTGATDPNMGLAVLCFEPEEIVPPPSCVDFSALPPGSSVEGLGTVAPDLNINSPGNAVVLAVDNDIAAAYGAPNAAANLGPSIVNNGLGPFGGFADVDHLNQDYHQYAFSFAPNTTVNYFSLQILDYGDFNPDGATAHIVDLVAYDSNNQVVTTDRLSFTSDSGVNPTSGSAGNLQITGDAISAQENEPGKFTFEVSGNGITRLEMQFSSDVGPGATDPNMGLAGLCFETETPPPTETPQTCEDLGYTTIAEDSWNEHVIDGMNPITLGYARPSAADYAIVNTGWEWTGNPGQEQVTEMHSVVTPFGTVTSQDYGNDELAGQVLWFGAPQGAFDQPSLQVTIDYAGDGSDPGSHRSHGLIAWCDNPDTEPPAPQEPLTCEDIGLEPVASADWSQHVIRDMTPVTDNFAQPDDANYVIVNTAWAWSGLPDQHQVTEKHSVDTPLGTAVSDDYGDEELDGELIWYDVLQGAFGSGNLPVTIDYAGNGSDPGSHFSKGLVNWCLDPNAPAASSTLLQPLGDDGAQVEVAYTCSDAAPTLVSATMNGYTVEDGQILWLVPNDDSFSNTVDGGLTAIYGPAFSLAVTCAAADGAQSTTIVVPDLGD